MKKKKFLQFLFVALITTSIISCKNSNPNLTGEWSSNSSYSKSLNIKMEDENYIINFGVPGGSPQTLIGKFDNGIIKTGSGWGDITYLKEKDKLYFGGAEFSRK